MNRLNNSFGRNAIRFLGVLFLVSLLTPRHFASGETVRFAGDSDLVGDAGRWTRAVAEDWAKKTNNTLEYISRPADATSTLQLYLQSWGSKVQMWTCTWSTLSGRELRPRMPLI